jgi:hypothetical protein
LRSEQNGCQAAPGSIDKKQEKINRKMAGIGGESMEGLQPLAWPGSSFFPLSRSTAYAG